MDCDNKNTTRNLCSRVRRSRLQSRIHAIRNQDDSSSHSHQESGNQGIRNIAQQEHKQEKSQQVHGEENLQEDSLEGTTEQVNSRQPEPGRDRSKGKRQVRRSQRKHQTHASQRQSKRNRSEQENSCQRSEREPKKRKKSQQQPSEKRCTRHSRRSLSDAPSSSVSTTTSAMDDIKCVICLDTVDATEMKFIRCGHGFHKICCDDWLKIKNICPVCRTVVPRVFVMNDNDQDGLGPVSTNIAALAEYNQTRLRLLTSILELGSEINNVLHHLANITSNLRVLLSQVA